MSLHSGTSAEKLGRDMERNYYMSAAEAKAYGMVDEVMPSLKTALQAVRK
jgi:ATP-dependent Clp protease protease subunit